MALDRVQSGEDHRLQLLESGERLRRLARGFGDRVADLRVANLLDVRDEKADFPDPELFGDIRLWREHPHLLRVVVLALGHQPDLHARPDHAVDDAHDDDDAPVGVVPGIEDERFQRRVGVAGGRR